MWNDIKNITFAQITNRLKDFLYEPNDEETHRHIVLAISDLIDPIKYENILFDYNVACDKHGDNGVDVTLGWKETPDDDASYATFNISSVGITITKDNGGSL